MFNEYVYKENQINSPFNKDSNESKQTTKRESQIRQMPGEQSIPSRKLVRKSNTQAVNIVKK